MARLNLLSRFLSPRVTAPITRRRLVIEALEDRTTPATFFVDNNLVPLSPITGAGGLNTQNLGYTVTDQNANNQLDNGDIVHVTLPGDTTATDLVYNSTVPGTVNATDKFAFNTITQALTAANSVVGTDDIIVGAGTYAESLNVNSAVTLTGLTGTASDVVIDPASGAGITVGADGVMISDLRVTGASDGITGTGLTSLTLDNVRVDTNTGTGLNLTGNGAGSTLTLSGVTLSGNTTAGATISGFPTLTVSGSPLADTFTLTGTSVTVTNSSNLNNQSIGLTGVTAVTLNGLAGADTFNVTPTAGVAVTVNGDLPGPTSGQGTTGDVLNLNLSGGLTPSFTGVTFNASTGYSGTVSFTGGSGAGNLTVGGIEKLANGATVSGLVFNDVNNNGQQDGSEGGLAGVTVGIDVNGDNTPDFTTTTGANGTFTFTGLVPGTYTVSLILGSRQTQTSPTSPTTVQVTGTLGSTSNTTVFGVHTTTGTGTQTSVINGFVFADVNRNGTFDTSGSGSSEHGVEGVTVFLDLNANGQLDQGEPSDVTDSTGAYTLTTTATGTAAIRVIRPTGFIQVGSIPSVSLPVTGGTQNNVNVPLYTNLPPQSTPARRFAEGVIVGGRAHVKIRGADGAEARDIDVTQFIGATEARVAFADVTGDGVEDIIIGSGPGVPNKLVVLNGKDLQPVFTTSPFESSYTGGLFVAAGDVTGDGIADIIVTPDEGGGPRVTVYRGGDFAIVANFFGIDDPNFRGGARATVADLNADGVPDLIVAAGFGGGPRIAFFDGTTVVGVNGVGQLRKLFNDIFVFEQTLRNGVFVAAGDFDDDGFADVAFGGGPGGGPRVLVLSGKDLLAGKAENSKALANFFAGDDSQRGGVRLAVRDIDNDGKDDLITGGGNGSRVRAFSGAKIRGGDTHPASEFENEAGDDRGVFVG